MKESEKTLKTLQNEKSVLQAGIDARESKLSKMTDLQSTCNELQAKVAGTDNLQSKLDVSNRRYQDLEQDMQKAQTMVEDGISQLEQRASTIAELQAKLAKEDKVNDNDDSNYNDLASSTAAASGVATTNEKNDAITKMRMCWR